MHLRFTQRRHRWALLAGTLLTALLALCAWGGWVAAQPDLGTFLLPGARDIRYKPVGPGMQSVLFTYDGAVVPQTDRLYTALARRPDVKIAAASASWARSRWSSPAGH